MNLGEKIVRLRNERGMSQEKLAEALNVSRQAVYKWEINESIPDKEKLSKLTQLFGVTYDFLLNDAIDYVTKEDKPSPAPAPEPVVVAVAVNQPEKKEEPKKEAQKPVATCAKCGREIFDDREVVHHNAIFSGIGRSKAMTSPAFDICLTCEQAEMDAARLKEFTELRRKKNKGIRWGIIITAIVLFIMIMLCVTAPEEYRVGAIVATIILGILTFPAIFSIFLDNTFAGDMWVEVASWGFVRMPGVIFSLDFDGLVFLIATKILLSILAFSLAAASIILATLLTMVCSPICFPLSIVRYNRTKSQVNAPVVISGK